MERATRLDQVKLALNPRPLGPDELDGFFVETTRARDEYSSRRKEIEQALNSKGSVKVLVAGHGGAGKSTELTKLQQELSARFFFVNFSLLREALVGKVTTEILLVLIVEHMLRAVKDAGASIDEGTLKQIYSWFSEVTEVKEEDLKYSGELGAGVNTGESFWGKLIGVSTFLKADIKTGSHTLNRTISRESKRLSELAFQCNLLVKEAVLAVQKSTKKDLVLIIEDLDKCLIGEADELFINNPAPLADLPCKAILTAPIYLLCNPRAVFLQTQFECVTFPMIKVRDKEGVPFPPGLEVIRLILEGRMDVSALMDDDAVELSIEKTGGVLRHLFDVVMRAESVVSQALEDGRRTEARITKSDIRYGLNRLKGELITRIGVMGLPPEFGEIKVEDLYRRLKKLHRECAKAPSDPENMLLLQAHALIEYNGEGWHCVHPLVAEHVETLPDPEIP